MKVLILANFDVGLYQFRRELIDALLQHHQVLISLPDGDLVRPLEALGCQFLDTPMDRRGTNPIRDIALFKRYRKLLREQRPDLVITYTIKPNIYGGLACRLGRIPYAVNITGLGTAFQKENMLRRLVVFLYKRALKRAKVVFFENSSNMELFQTEDIVSADRCCCLNGAGVNLDRYEYSPYPDTVPIRFLFIGRVMKEKGIDELLTAMRRLQADGQDCCLDVLGGCEEDYTEILRGCEAEGWLHYHGYQKDVRPFIQAAHCFVLPSYHEGMANTNLECAAMGRPVITSDIPGCREAVIDGESGLLCNAKDEESLYRAMKKFLELPKDVREQMGKAGRKRMEEVFDKKKVVEETMKGLDI